MSESLRNPELRQEEDRLSPSIILLVFGLVGVVGIFLVSWAWYGLQKRERALRPSRSFPERELGPRHTVAEDLENIYGEMGPGQTLNEEKRRQLGSFQWVDRRHGIVAIPIDDAIALILERERRP
jgi:hypothetical protein